MPGVAVDGPMLDAISNEIVALKVEFYGKGPESAKAYINDNLVVCRLDGGLTTVEQTLVEGGRRDLVREVRLVFEEMMADEFRAAVERVTGYKVATYHSQMAFDPCTVIEFFVLEEPGAAEATS